MDYTKETVKFILQNANRFEWSLQGLGMLRLYLSKELRLHIWDDRYKVPNVSEVHSHPWTFRSTIIAGVMYEYRYTPNSQIGYNYSGVLIQCGENSCIKEKLPGLRLHNEKKFYHEGEDYELAHDVLHSSHALSGTVTLVRRFFREDTEHAKVYWPVFGTDPGWVDAKPRKATPKEIKAIVGNALERHFK